MRTIRLLLLTGTVLPCPRARGPLRRMGPGPGGIHRGGARRDPAASAASRVARARAAVRRAGASAPSRAGEPRSRAKSRARSAAPAERSQPRPAERPEPRGERPEPRGERPEPRGERPEPRGERRPEPREAAPERPAPRQDAPARPAPSRQDEPAEQRRPAESAPCRSRGAPEPSRRPEPAQRAAPPAELRREQDRSAPERSGQDRRPEQPGTPGRDPGGRSGTRRRTGRGPGSASSLGPPEVAAARRTRSRDAPERRRRESLAGRSAPPDTNERGGQRGAGSEYRVPASQAGPFGPPPARPGRPGQLRGRPGVPPDARCLRTRPCPDASRVRPPRLGTWRPGPPGRLRNGHDLAAGSARHRTRRRQGDPSDRGGDRRDGFNTPGRPGYVPGGFRDDDDVRDYDQVRRDRREFNEDGRTYIREPGRIIVRDRDNYFIRHDENERFRDLDRRGLPQRAARRRYRHLSRPARRRADRHHRGRRRPPRCAAPAASATAARS